MPKTVPLITPFKVSCSPSLLFVISPTHHYPYCTLATVVHPSFVLPARSIILSILPFRPPGFSFLVWPGITLQTVVNGMAVSAFLCVLFQSVCVERKRRRRKKQRVKDVSQVPAYPYSSSLPHWVSTEPGP